METTAAIEDTFTFAADPLNLPHSAQPSGSMRDGDLELRSFMSADSEGLDELFAEPEVKLWWRDPDYDRDNGWVAEVAGELAGWVQYEEECYEWYPSVALDIALTTLLEGRGYGRRALRLVASSRP
jgi:aminoglycoside 6'-N-acetyltransferase